MRAEDQCNKPVNTIKWLVEAALAEPFELFLSLRIKYFRLRDYVLYWRQISFEQRLWRLLIFLRFGTIYKSASCRVVRIIWLIRGRSPKDRMKWWCNSLWTYFNGLFGIFCLLFFDKIIDFFFFWALSTPMLVDYDDAWNNSMILLLNHKAGNPCIQ